MKLYHYYEKATGPFKSISDLPDEKAEQILKNIRTEKPDIFLGLFFCVIILLGIYGVVNTPGKENRV